ncbi:MAG TPA: hypothetical protein VFU36_03435, partial [Jatrophihabitans sp.]|nr:hypothetical protein [Jatrophihabitans sp.]
MPHEEIAELVVRASGPGERNSRQFAALVPALTGSARAAGPRAVAAGRWLVDLVVEISERVPVRDAQTLRQHHRGLTDIEIAERLVKSATRTTAGIGAAVGGLSSVEFLAPPTLIAAPVQLAAEMLTVTAVELKLVAELHEILGYPAQGSAAERGSLYLVSWMRRR